MCDPRCKKYIQDHLRLRSDIFFGQAKQNGIFYHSNHNLPVRNKTSCSKDTNNPSFDWIHHYPLAVSVCDQQGVIIAINRLAAEHYSRWGGMDLLGQSLFDCHPETVNVQLRRMLNEQSANIYYKEKQGQRKLVHQYPWYDDAGGFAGLVETVVPLAQEVPVFKHS